MKLCKYCQVRKAEVPDRYRSGSPRKTVCRECHTHLLAGDLAEMLKAERERSAKREAATA